MRIFTSDVSTANALVRADERSEVEAWHDPLTFGRLAAGADLDAFVASRSIAYAAASWDEDAVAEQDLKARNAALRAALAARESVFLLFGGSLRDQLHLAQICAWLDTLSETATAGVKLALIDGPLSVFSDGALLEVVRSSEVLDLTTCARYASVWHAVTGDDVAAVVREREAAQELGMNALAAGLARWLRELPSVENGLSITQLQTLDAVRLGVTQPRELFRAVQATEKAPFRIDWEFWQVLRELCSGEIPLLKTADGAAFLCPPHALAFEAFDAQRLELTDRGRDVLEGRSNCMSGGFPERWLGGLWLDAGATWFWDYANDRAVPSSEAAV